MERQGGLPWDCGQGEGLGFRSKHHEELGRVVSWGVT